MSSHGIGLGRLVLALDRALVNLTSEPRGLDITIGSASLIDPNDLHLPLHSSARTADLFLIVGASGNDVINWLGTFDPGSPAAIMVKTPEPALVEAATERGVAVITVEPQARWERIYNLVAAVLETAGTHRTESGTAGTAGDLFDLATQVSHRTHGLVSIEDDRSHVLAYSSTGDEADELRRLSILGREGPPEMLAWLRQWGVMDALRTTSGVVAIDEREALGLRRRLAISIRAPQPERGLGEFLGTVWLQCGSDPLADDAAEILTGAAAVAARIIGRRRNAGTGHDEIVRRLLGAGGNQIDADHLGSQLGIATDADLVVVGFGGLDASGSSALSAPPSAPLVSSLTLHASAFSPLSVTTTIRSRAYVVLPGADGAASVEWARTAVAAALRQFGAVARAVVAGPDVGLACAAALRHQADRVLDAALRESALIDPVTTVAASRTGVLLGEIVAMIEANPELTDPRVLELTRRDEASGSQLIASLRSYLDHFGDVRVAAQALHVHPNTLRYRIRRVTALTGLDLDDPATRLVVALTLRAQQRAPLFFVRSDKDRP